MTSASSVFRTGKTTILRILAGRHIHPTGAVTVLGRNSFHDTSLNFHRVYMGCDWGRRTVAFAGYGCVTAIEHATHILLHTLPCNLFTAALSLLTWKSQR